MYLESLDTIINNFSSNIDNGLSQNEVDKRLEKYGKNALEGGKKRSFLQKFLEQFKDYMLIILVIAAVISFALETIQGTYHYMESIVILLIVVGNALLGTIQENNAEKSLDALQKLSAPNATVLRDGKAQKIEAINVVPGDIILLEAGDMVPADARLIECASLKSDESALTGESVPVEKHLEAVLTKDSPLGDRINMVYSGCPVTYGRAVAIVTGTGMETEMGKIAGLLKGEVSEPTPLQQRLNNLGKTMGIMAIVICGVIMVVGILQKEDVFTMFMTAVSLAVAAIPEGLSTVVTLVLAIGVQKMVKENAIIRQLPAVETLGSTTVICSDKTGTLTQNKMTVMEVWPFGGKNQMVDNDITEEAKELIMYSVLCNDGKVRIEDGKEIHIGDPTETALVAAGLKVGIVKKEAEEKYKRIAEIPFDSDRKRMSTVHEIDGQLIAVIKGGYDVMTNLCEKCDFSQADVVNEEMAEQALRVLAVAFKILPEMPSEITPETLETDLHFLGLIGMIDPPREESKEAIKICKTAGIKTVMITGDHVTTATAIAKELGILKDKSEALTGVQLAAMSEEELRANVHNYSVYARVSPEDKIKIVKALQSHGDVVAMTGDGVNDAPALKAADIGCAMGITGTEVAKGAADMVLTDDNFSTIVAAVEEGRSIYDNIRKTIEFLLGSNIGEVLTVLIAMIAGWKSPLLAIQILMVNVVTDAFPAFALGFEAPGKSIMLRKPIRKDDSVFADGLGIRVILRGILVTALTLTGFYLGQFVFGKNLEFDAAHSVGQTMAFLVLSISQLVMAYTVRSKASLFKKGLFSNKKMNQAFLLSLAIVLLITLVPFLENIFGMVDLGLTQWLVVVGLSILPLVITEIIKLFIKPKSPETEELNN